jgi:hypothetical protein
MSAPRGITFALSGTLAAAGGDGSTAGAPPGWESPPDGEATLGGALGTSPPDGEATLGGTGFVNGWPDGDVARRFFIW